MKLRKRKLIKYKSKSKFLNKEKEHALFKEYQATRSEKLKNEIVENYAALVFSYAKKMCHNPSQYEDIVQEGFIGLVTAIEKFDLSKNCRFLHYANFWVKAKIYTFIIDNAFLVNAPLTHSFIKGFWSFSKHKHLSDAELAEAFKISAEQVGMLRSMTSKSSVMYLDAPCSRYDNAENNSNKILNNMSVTNFETEFVNKQENGFKLNNINDSLQTLKPKEKDVMMKYFMEEKTLDEIGREYNLSRQRVEQIKKISIKKIRKFLDVEVNV
jgi:RNA polymerase sigma factor (sigma-70 family)